MAAFESDLESVLADERDVLHTQVLGVQADNASKASGSSGLAATFSARAGPTQSLGRVAAAVPVLPRDHHDLTFAVDVDRHGKWIGVFQVGLTGR